MTKTKLLYDVPHRKNVAFEGISGDDASRFLHIILSIIAIITAAIAVIKSYWKKTVQETIWHKSTDIEIEQIQKKIQELSSDICDIKNEFKEKFEQSNISAKEEHEKIAIWLNNIEKKVHELIGAVGTLRRQKE